MRYATVLILLGLLLFPAALCAEEGSGSKDEEKPKTELEILQEKVKAILVKLTASFADEIPSEDFHRIRDGVETELLALGAKAIPVLLPYTNPAKLKEVLGKTDTEFSSRIKTLVKKLGWVSPEMKATLQLLMAKLRNKKGVPQEDSPRFAELGDYAAQALFAEMKVNRLASVRERICEILGSMGSAGILTVVDALLHGARDTEVPVRVRAFRALVLTARDENNFKPLDKIFGQKKAYQRFVNHLAFDPDLQVRLHAATVLGWMETPQATQALYAIVVRDANPSLSSESAWALLGISGIDSPEGEKWELTKAKLKAWWAKKKGTLRAQIVPAKPAIRVKPKTPDKGDKKDK